MPRRTRDTKPIERLVALTNEKMKILRELAIAGNFQAEYDNEREEEKKYSDRLKELREHNARVEAEAKALGYKSNAEREAAEDKAAAEVKAKADAEAQAKAEADAKAKLEADAKAKLEADAKANADKPPVSNAPVKGTDTGK